jgi:hypothetical protein
MAKKPLSKSFSKTKTKKKKVIEIEIICEMCEKNVVPKERFELINKKICIECAELDNTQIMAVQDCDKDGATDLSFVDSRTYNAYAKNGAKFLED